MPEEDGRMLIVEELKAENLRVGGSIPPRTQQ